jgi:hypothetical protein
MRENPYPGINAHLNSLLQTPGTDDQPAIWHTFHTQHVANIGEALNAQLPDHYIAFSEQSLQKRTIEDDFGTIEVHRPQPDVTVFQQGTGRTPEAVAIAPTWQARIADVLEPVKQPRAVVIREVSSQGKLGRVVTRIELLSPSNKPFHRHYPAYEARRMEAIDSDVPLIEIDYLHESRSVLLQLPIYPTASNSHPFSIIVSDPRPNWSEGKVSVYAFDAAEPIARFPVPLANDEQIVFDLTPVYQHTFRAGRWGNLLDYTTTPERFETYHVNDQQRIRDIMTKVAKPSDS